MITKDIISQENINSMQYNLLRRPRLRSLIHTGLQYPLLLVLAAPGYSKSQTMADYLLDNEVSALWIRLNHLDNFPTHFWYHIIRSISEGQPELAENMTSLGFPQTPSMFVSFANMLEKLIDDHKEGSKETVWVFDDFSEINNNEIKKFIWMLSEAELKGFHIVLLSNDFTGIDAVMRMTKKRYVIQTDDLRFTHDEIFDLFHMHGVTLTPEEISKIMRYTEGWALPIHLFAIQ